MNETQWSESGEPGKKKSLPKWLWFCGGGCLLALILGVASIFVFANYIKKATDPEHIELALQRVLPHDPLPSEMQLQFYNSLGIEQFQLMDSRGFQLQVQVHDGADGSRARKDMFGDDDPKFPQNLGVMKFDDLEKGVVEVQGRPVPVLRMKMEFTGFMANVMPEEARNQMGSMLFADLTRESSAGEPVPSLVLMQIFRVAGGSGPVTDEEVQTLLEPFHVGPKR